MSLQDRVSVCDGGGDGGDDRGGGGDGDEVAVVCSGRNDVRGGGDGDGGGGRVGGCVGRVGCGGGEDVHDAKDMDMQGVSQVFVVFSAVKKAVDNCQNLFCSLCRSCYR